MSNASARVESSFPQQTKAVASIATPAQPFCLGIGERLERVDIAYETFGSPDAENIILVCHALTGDAHVTRAHADDRPGWWEKLIGPGMAIDTRQCFVVCSNVLGGCSGSTGPTSIDPETGLRYGPTFPAVSIEDMVDAQVRLLDHLEVKQPVTVIGGSIGGLQALDFSLRHPDRIRAAAVIAAGARLGAFGVSFNAIGRNAIAADSRFKGGHYPPDDPPIDGLAVARQLAHLTYRTSDAFERRFGRRRSPEICRPDSTVPPFEVESYLAHKGRSFVNRFDANAYIALSHAMDAYDAGEGDQLRQRLSTFKGQLLTVAFESDWLFPPALSIELAQAGRDAGVSTQNVVLETQDGHDAFLMEHDGLGKVVRDLLS